MHHHGYIHTECDASIICHSNNQKRQGLINQAIYTLIPITRGVAYIFPSRQALFRSFLRLDSQSIDLGDCDPSWTNHSRGRFPVDGVADPNPNPTQGWPWVTTALRLCRRLNELSAQVFCPRKGARDQRK